MGKKGNGGLVTLQIKDWLSGIMYGDVDHEWTTVVPTDPREPIRYTNGN